MATTLLIPGLLCDRYVWEPLLARMDAQVAELFKQDSLTAMAQDCLDAFAGPLNVAGFSMGGRVAMEMVRIAPERIARLALLDTGMHPLGPNERARRLEFVRIGREEGMEALARVWLPAMVHEPNRTPELVAGLTAMVLRRDAQLHERQIKALTNRPDASAYLGKVRCPVLLAAGEHDNWSPVAHHEEMAALIPGARLEVIAGSGHFTLVERPVETAAILEEFLQGD